MKWVEQQDWNAIFPSYNSDVWWQKSYWKSKDNTWANLQWDSKWDVWDKPAVCLRERSWRNQFAYLVGKQRPMLDISWNHAWNYQGLLMNFVVLWDAHPDGDLQCSGGASLCCHGNEFLGDVRAVELTAFQWLKHEHREVWCTGLIVKVDVLTEIIWQRGQLLSTDTSAAALRRFAWSVTVWPENGWVLHLPSCMVDERKSMPWSQHRRWNVCKRFSRVTGWAAIPHQKPLDHSAKMACHKSHSPSIPTAFVKWHSKWRAWSFSAPNWTRQPISIL